MRRLLAFIALLATLLPGVAGAAASYAVAGSAQGKSVASLTVPAVSYAVGDIIVVGVYMENAVIGADFVTAVTPGWTFTSHGQTSTAVAETFEAFDFTATSAGTSDIAVDFDGASSYAAMTVGVVSGSSGFSVSAATASLVTTNKTSGNITAADGDLLVGFTGASGPIGDAAPSSGPYAIQQRNGTTGGLAAQNATLADWILTGNAVAGVQAFTATLSTARTAVTAVLAYTSAPATGNSVITQRPEGGVGGSGMTGRGRTRARGRLQ